MPGPAKVYQNGEDIIVGACYMESKNMQRSDFSRMSEFYENKVLEEGFDKNAYVAECRISCGTEVIIKKALAFLPKSRDPSSPDMVRLSGLDC
mmetsp:Transcript_22192/g.44903  ORF Transcript_22192/g.44903 Transcript_22192/m.44903 type:complete len:93 (+) Transcript_22192:1323-1601(+)